MAQRTGPDGFLASGRKAASARFRLALAALFALFALAGCGGDSDSESESASPSAQEAASATAPGGASSNAGPGSGPGAGTGTSQGKGPGAAAAGGGASEGDGGQGKRGPRVPVPQGSPEPGFTPEQRTEATVADISLTSPAVRPLTGAPATLPPTYTCDGENSWPELRWQGAPAGTEEMALFAMSLVPVEGKLFFDWAIAGIDPELGVIEASRLPKGAVVGQNGFGREGYSICPPPGQSETYFFALYALPEELSVSRGFDPRELRERVKEISGNVGLLPVSYARAG